MKFDLSAIKWLKPNRLKMLYEIKGVEQHKGESKRRWFFDHDIDLCAWIDNRDQIIGFQIFYDKATDPHALTWFENKGFFHNRVVDDPYHLPNTLVADGVFDKTRIISLLDDKSIRIDPYVAEFILKKLSEY